MVACYPTNRASGSHDVHVRVRLTRDPCTTMGPLLDALPQKSTSSRPQYAIIVSSVFCHQILNDMSFADSLDWWSSLAVFAMGGEPLIVSALP